MNIRIVYGYDLSYRDGIEIFDDIKGYETPYGGNSDPAFFGIELDRIQVYDRVYVASLSLNATPEQIEEFNNLFNHLNDKQKVFLNELGDPQEVLVYCV